MFVSYISLVTNIIAREQFVVIAVNLIATVAKFKKLLDLWSRLQQVMFTIGVKV